MKKIVLAQDGAFCFAVPRLSSSRIVDGAKGGVLLIRLYNTSMYSAQLSVAVLKNAP